MRREDLHPYQVYCCEYIKSHPEALLLLDCGLGKTIVTLMAVLDLMYDRFEVSKTLVVAPLRVARSVWPEELKKWDGLDFLRMSVLVGDAKQRAAALAAPADVYVINRENVKWLTDFLEKRHQPWPFDMVILDELSGFKNPQSQRWRALRKVRPQIRRMVGLTGTPASNGLMDLWAEVYLIDQGARLGRFISRYREAYFRPAGMNPCTGVVYSYALRPGAEEQIYQRIGDISVSMKARDYLDMPACLTVNHRVAMDPPERKLYESMKKDLLIHLEDETLTADSAAALSNKLLQMANGAVYAAGGEPKTIHEKKLEALLDLIEQANGQSVLVCCWYRHDHDRIQAYLSARGIPTWDLKSDEDIADWNAGRIPVALISPASAGHGLNIQQGGHCLIWFSLVWSLELYQQTNARLWRQGQRADTVVIHHIIAADTVDEQILAALSRKEMTQEALLSAVRAELKKGAAP